MATVVSTPTSTPSVLEYNLLGGVSGAVTSTEVDPVTGKPHLYQNGPGQNLRLVSFTGGPWNEAKCIAAESAAKVAANNALQGVNTLAGHATGILADLGITLTAGEESAFKGVTTMIDGLIGRKITASSALALLPSALAAAGVVGVIPAAAVALLPTVESLVEGLFGIKAPATAATTTPAT